MLFTNVIRDGMFFFFLKKKTVTNIPLDEVLESLYTLRIRESDQLKTVLELHDLEIHQKISIISWKRWWKEVYVRNFDYENLTPAMRELKQVQWLRVAGDLVVSKGDKEFAINGKQKDSVRKPLHPLSHQHQEVEVRREKGPSVVGVHLGSPIDSRATTYWKVIALNYLVTIGILPNVNFVSQNRVVDSSTSARFHTGRLKNNQLKSRQRLVTKVQRLYWKMCDSWFVFFKTQSRRNLHRFYARAQKSSDHFDEYVSQKLRSVTQTSEKTKDHRSVKYNSKLLINAVPTQWNLRIHLRNRLKDRSDVPAETRGDRPRTS